MGAYATHIQSCNINDVVDDDDDCECDYSVMVVVGSFSGCKSMCVCVVVGCWWMPPTNAEYDYNVHKLSNCLFNFYICCTLLLFNNFVSKCKSFAYNTGGVFTFRKFW